MNDNTTANQTLRTGPPMFISILYQKEEKGKTPSLDKE